MVLSLALRLWPQRRGLRLPGLTSLDVL